MKKIFLGIALAVLMAMAFLAGSRYGRVSHSGDGNNGARKVLYYTDPMNPGNRYEKPGIAPCGMPLEPVYADGGGQGKNIPMLPGSVVIPIEKQQLIGVKVELVEKAGGAHTFRLLGKVAADETRIYQLNSSIQGWIRQVLPYSTGSLVKKGQLLATFYAPEFIAAEQAYIYSLTSTNYRPTFKVGSAQPNLIGQTTQQYEDNLRNLGMGDNQIMELAKTREFQSEIRIESPVTGFILSRNISPGLRFDKGAEFYRIANLQKVWIVLDTYGDEAKYFRPGQMVPFRSQGKIYHARVTNVLPQFDPVTRTMKVRLEAANPQYQLRPDMFVDVEFTANMPPAITVPIDALLDSGLKKTIFVDKGNGVFEPRQVETGSYYNDRVEILKGIMPGERIVVSGNFLIDSESRMKGPSSASSGSASQDPSCGMMVNEENAKASGLTSGYGGKTFFFCSRECKEKFDKSPRSYSGGGASTMPMKKGKPAGNSHEHHGNSPDQKNHQMHDSMPGQMHMPGEMNTEVEKIVPEIQDHKSMQMKMPDGMPQERMNAMEGAPEEKNQGQMNMGNDNSRDAGNPSTDGMHRHD